MLVAAVAAIGQQPTGKIAGTITSLEGGAAVVGASIEVKDEATGIVKRGVSNELGRFTVDGLPAAVYEFSITAPHFIKYVHAHIPIAANKASR